MLYIFGINIPENKSVYIGLTYISGIGLKRSKIICNKLGINLKSKIYHLTENQIYKIMNFIQTNYSIETYLKKDTKSNIIRLIDIRCYRGKRHRYNLPVRGQRTHTNAQTSKKINKN